MFASIGTNTDNVFGISVSILCDITHDIDTILHVNSRPKQCIRMYDVCSFRCRSKKPETDASVYKATAEGVP